MKRNIFRLMTLCTVAVLALASCKKDNGNDGNVPEKGFLATIEQPGGNGGSRTHINPENWNDGTTWPVLWTEGDQILVYNGSITTFQLQSGANTDNGIFLPADGEEYDYSSGPFSAIYCPETYGLNPEQMISGTTAVAIVPTLQYYKANSFAEGAMPMAAYGDGQTLEFKNLAGGLCFPIVSERPMTIKTIMVESLDANDAVSGPFNIDCSDPTLQMTPYSGANGPVPGVTLRIPGPGGVTLDANNPVYFTVMVAPGSLEKGFTLRALNEYDLVVYKKTVDWSAEPHTGFITRSVIKKVNGNLEINETDFAGLTFEAKTPGATVYISNDFEEDPWPSLEYSINGTAWDSYNGEPITLANAGDKVFFRGDNESFNSCTEVYDTETGTLHYEYRGSHFSCDDGECYVYGNIMSILNKENFATATTVLARGAFYALFEGNQYISNHPEKPLVLPATTLSISCYEKMFKGCTGLTSAPELPATTLAESCYANMFENCSNLNYIKCLATNISASNCTQNWVQGVSSTGTFVKDPSMTRWTTGNNGIPSGWTVQDASL